MDQVNSFLFPSNEQKAHELALAFMKEKQNANLSEEEYFNSYYRIYEKYKSLFDKKLGY